jgi:hypothetical protein
MQNPCKEEEIFKEERLTIHRLLANNPNYFGTVPNIDFAVVKPIKFNTSYEELTCIGVWPERNLLEATLLVKLPFGFLGNKCSQGSYEYVRFFIDWDNDGDFNDANEDLGVARVNVHDVPQVKEHPLCYAVKLPFKPFLTDCRNPYIVKLRAILSWEIVPPAGDWNFIPIWGNILECWIQIEPIEGKIVGVVAKEEVKQEIFSEKEAVSSKIVMPDKERVQFLELLKQNPNYFGTLPISDLKPIYPMKCDTRYEELKCIGIYPEEDFLEAILHIKLPFGFLGNLCGPGSYEYVRFFIDWDSDGDFMDFNEDVGVAAVNVHDIPDVRKVRLCYAFGKHFRALRAVCQRPYIVKLRAILSWQQVPTGPNFIPVWGNIKECWIQIEPTDPIPDSLAAEITKPVAASPPTCVGVGPTVACSLAGVTIAGRAYGPGFASYRIEYRSLSSPLWIQTGVVYPDCSPASASPDHSTPRYNEPLAFLTNLEPDEYEVRLTVNGTGGPLTRFTVFSLHRAPVVIDKIGQIDTRVVGVHPGDPSELLKLVKLNVTGPETSVGGSISVVGSADFYGCGREMIEYVLQYKEAPCGLGASPQGTPTAPPVPAPACTPPPQQDAPAPWMNIKPQLPFGDITHPRWYYCWPFNRPNFVLNGKLNRIWLTRSCILSLTLPGPVITYHDVQKTEESSWDTRALNGRYTVRLLLRHQDIPHLGPIGELYDATTVWLDNRDILVKLTGLTVSGGADLDGCAQVKLSQFFGTTAEIKGRAWDPLILNNEPSWLKPNDNFDYYVVHFCKDGMGGYVTNGIMIADNTMRVPNVLPILPPGNDEGVLANWDIINALDAGPKPDPYTPPPYPKLYRGEHCAYLIRLYARDKTYINDMGDIHDAEDFWPLCIVNDLE